MLTQGKIYGIQDSKIPEIWSYVPILLDFSDFGPPILLRPPHYSTHRSISQFQRPANFNFTGEIFLVVLVHLDQEVEVEGEEIKVFLPAEAEVGQGNMVTGFTRSISFPMLVLRGF